VLFIFGFLLFPGKTFATTYYVSTTGTDDVTHGTNTGTNAWLTLNYALTGNRLLKGDVINIEAGIYDSYYSTNLSLKPSIIQLQVRDQL